MGCKILGCFGFSNLHFMLVSEVGIITQNSNSNTKFINSGVFLFVFISASLDKKKENRVEQCVIAGGSILKQHRFHSVQTSRT